ncbi:MAG: QueT transporter family protein, partial [Faecalibacterium prausnitzii]|nr:QueT transporter family protein [Faecalibacterium prausnitzii]
RRAYHAQAPVGHRPRCGADALCGGQIMSNVTRIPDPPQLKVLGCFLANLLGSTIVDVIFGTLATLLACLVTYKLRNIRFKGLALAASLPPVVFNAVIIGIEIAVMFPDPSSSAPLWLACVTNGISVGIGELISCTVLGVLLVRIIEASPAVRKVFES